MLLLNELARKMVRDLLKISFVFLILFSTQACKTNSLSKNRTIEIKSDEYFSLGDKAPDFNLPFLEKVLSSKEIEYENLSDRKFSSLNSSPVLINFWASWCTPCIKEMKSLESLQEKYNKNLRVVYVNTDSKSSFNEAIKVLKENNIRGNVFFDPELITIQEFMVSGFPETFLIDNEGRFQYIEDPKSGTKEIRVIGERSWDSEVMTSYLDTILKDKSN